MASETLSFDIIGRDAGASSTFRRVGDTATLAARGARTCAIALEQQRKAADTSAGATLALAKADKILADAEDELSGKTARARREMERTAESARKASGGGPGGGRGFAGKLISGGGPGILGISGKLAALTAGGGALAATIPALGAIGGVVTALGAGIGLLVSKGGPLHKEAVGLMKDVTSVFRQAAGPLIGPLRDAFKQFGGFLHQIGPLLKQVFAAAAPFIGPLLHGLEAAVKGVLPGFVALLKAAGPAVRVLGQVLGTIGKNLGTVFAGFVPVIKSSAVVLKALAGVLAGILPVAGKVIAVFARAFAPVITDLAGALKALEPVFVLIGQVIASFAKAAFSTLAGVLGAVVTLIKGIGPSLAVLAKTLGGVFATLQNTGVFTILANALEQVAKPLANLINAIVTGLAPVLPPIIKLVSDVSGELVKVLVAALKAVIPVVIKLVQDVLQPLVPLINTALVPLIGLLAKGLGTVLVAAIKLVTPALNGTIKVLGWVSDALTAVVKWIVRVAKNWKQIWNDLVQWIWHDFAEKIVHFFTKTIPTAFDIFKNAVAITWDGIKILFLKGAYAITGIMAKLPGPLGAPFKAAHKAIGNDIAGIQQDVSNMVARINQDLDRLHGKTTKVRFSLSASGGHILYTASGGRVPGYGGGDRFPAMLEGGEAVVPKHLVPAVAPFLSANRVPGFALGGYAGQFTPSLSTFAHEFGGKWWDTVSSIVRYAAAHFVPSISGGAGVARWRPAALAVLGRLGLPYADVGTVLSQMATESGGNPYAINKWDSNWLAGTPSVGLMQVIGPTFGAYAGPFRRTGPFAYGVSENPMANIYAGINYAIHRYGNPGWLSVLGHGHGYDHGGWLRPGLTLAYNGTGRPERVLGPGQGGVVIRIGGRGGGRNSLDALLREWLRHNVRVEGGGDVQVAFGGS